MLPRIFTISIISMALLSVTRAYAETIYVFGLFKDMAILEVNGKQRKLRKGDSSPEGITLISADSEAAVLEVNGERKRYSLGSRFSTKFAKKRRTEARIWPNKGMYAVPGSINQQPVSFLLDTGATWVAMNARVAKRLGINYRYLGKEGRANTASGTARIFMVNLENVRVGEIELKNVQGAVIEGDSTDDVLLGMSFLNRVDFKREGQMMLLQSK